MLRDVNEHRRYRVEIYWSGEAQGFVACAPDLKGAVVVGSTRASAAEMINTIIDAFLRVAHETNDVIPEPTRSPADIPIPPYRRRP